MMETVQIYTGADPISAIEKSGRWIAKSGIMPLPKEESGQAVAIVMAQTGMNLLEVAATYHIMTDGRWSMKSNAALARFRQKGGKHKWIKTGEDLKEAIIELTYDGQTITSRFSMEDAKRMEANFKPGSNWTKTPANMLRARAITNGIAMIAPEIYSDDFTDVQEPAPEMNLAKATPPVEKVLTPDFKPSQVHVEPAKEVKAEVVIEQSAEVKPQRPVPAGELPVETVQKLMDAIGGEQEGAALAYMIGLKWLQDGQHLGNLTKSRADMILNGTERFKKAVADAAAKAK